MHFVMSSAESARMIFESGFNCAQSMLFAYGKEYFSDPDADS